VFIEREPARAVAAFNAAGMVLAQQDCATIESNVGDALWWCALHNQRSGLQAE